MYYLFVTKVGIGTKKILFSTQKMYIITIANIMIVSVII